MTQTPPAAIILAAGLGTRMHSATPKHLHPLLGRRLADWVIEAVRALGPEPLVVVTSPDAREAFEGETVAVQETPRGTGDATARGPREPRRLRRRRARRHRRRGDDHERAAGRAARDAPLRRRRRDRALLRAATTRAPTAASSANGDGALQAIVEARDASEQELAIREVNSSIYVFEAAKLWPALERLTPQNAQGELYLTDTVRDLVAAGERVAVHMADDPTEAEGVNTRAELAAAAAVLRDRINLGHMLAGATIVDPATTWIDPAVELEPDCTIQPFTVLRGGTRVARGAEVGPHVVAVDAEIGPGTLVGPFCYLRPGTVLETGAKAGAFVEIKNSRIGERTKVPHQSYIGDAEIGADTNIAAGNITVNFPHQPGQPKGRTTIGRNVRTGVHNAFVAPVEIGDDAWIGAGSVITEDVPPESLAVARARQENKEGYVRRKREQEDE